MRRAVACLTVTLVAALPGVAVTQRAPQATRAPLERLRALAVRGDTAALFAAVRQHPDDARELARRLVVAASAQVPRAADSTVAVARRLTAAYAAAWGDSFPHAQVARFAGMSRRERAAKVAADSVRRAGNDALAREGPDAALALWREAARRASATGDTAGLAAALGNIGAGHYRAARYDSAEHYLDRSRALAEAAGDRRTALNAVGVAASVAKDRGDRGRARALYARALELRSRIGDVRGMAADENNLGLLSAAHGDWGTARVHFDRSLALARRHGLDEAAAVALLNLGNAASVDAEYAEASRRYAEALALRRALGHEADAALVLHNLGLLALRRGDFVAARARLAEALAIFERVGSLEDRVLVQRDLAAAAAAAGDLQGALGPLRRAGRLLGRGGDAPELAAGLALARADLAAALNDYAEAERHYARAEALYRNAGSASGEAEARQGRALMLVERAQYARALELLRAVARAQESVADPRPLAHTRLAIGHAHHRRGDLAAARTAFGSAADRFRALGDPVGEAAALAALGDVESDAGAPHAAEALYRLGLARTGERSAPGVRWQLRAGLGRALQARGALPEASAELRRALDDVERTAATLALGERRATFLADKWDVYARLAAVELARGDPAAAFAASERLRARQMLELLARGRVAASPVADAALAEREQDLRRQIAELTERLEADERGVRGERGVGSGDGAGGAVPASDLTRATLARAQEQYAQLLLELREDGVAHGPMARADVAPWRDVAARLAPGEALVEYLVSDSGAVAFVVTPDTLRAVPLAVGRAGLEPLVEFARGAIARPPARTAHAPATARWRAPLRRLHALLVAPLEDAGALAGVRRLVIVPHVELHYLPFAALVRGGTDEFLVERYEVGYAPSASVWLRLAARAQSAAPAGAGAVLALAPRTEALPGSRDEVEALRALYGPRATVLVNGAASEPALRAAAGRYDVVHLATFGVLNKHNPLFSYVTLRPGGGHDGRLEVHEVFGAALRARLVVLSACQTGLASGATSDVPAGDDWVGLVRAFLGAGAQNVVATLWPVEDRSTARLMGAFYRGLRAGEVEASALAGAQRAALRNPATADPFYWAGFVLVGGADAGGR